jgi:hypothetical protein
MSQTMARHKKGASGLRRPAGCWHQRVKKKKKSPSPVLCLPFQQHKAQWAGRKPTGSLLEQIKLQCPYPHFIDATICLTGVNPADPLIHVRAREKCF